MIDKIKANHIRMLREKECFPIINRGLAWYNTLSSTQQKELDEWYKFWLDAPKTGICPGRPAWIK